MSSKPILADTDTAALQGLPDTASKRGYKTAQSPLLRPQIAPLPHGCHPSQGELGLLVMAWDLTCHLPPPLLFIRHEACDTVMWQLQTLRPTGIIRLLAITMQGRHVECMDSPLFYAEYLSA